MFRHWITKAEKIQTLARAGKTLEDIKTETRINYRTDDGKNPMVYYNCSSNITWWVDIPNGYIEYKFYKNGRRLKFSKKIFEYQHNDTSNPVVVYSIDSNGNETKDLQVSTIPFYNME